MKSTFCVRDPMLPVFHLLELGVGVGVTQIVVFLYTNMLVSPAKIVA